MAGRRGAAILLLLAWVGVSRSALAAGDPVEDDLIKQGVESRRQHDDVGALALFEKAYQLHHAPRAAAQIGLAEQALGRWIESEAHLGEALAAASDPWIRKNGSALQEALSHVRRQLGDLEVLGGPGGAEIVIEGQVRGTLPLAKAIRVRAGECRFDVRARGYASLSRTVEIAAGVMTRETVNLSPLIASVPAGEAGGATGTPAFTAPTPSLPEKPLSASPESEPAETEQGHPARHTVAWVTSVAAAAAIVTGVVGTVIWQEKRSAFDSHVGPPPSNPQADPSTWGMNCAEPAVGRGGPGCSTLYNAAQQGREIAIIGYAAGAALAAGATVLFLTSRREHGAGGAAVACAPSPVSLAMGCMVTF
jgi:hypothetical protein